MTKEEWYAKGEELFGSDKMQWRFICPACGHVASVQDYKNVGAPEGAVGFSCVGRWSSAEARQAFEKGKGPCNYAGHGLIRLNPVEITNADGEKLRVFAFAEPAAAASIEAGMRVHWTAVSTGRRTFSMTRKEGTVTAIDGAVAKVKSRNGRAVEVDVVRLRTIDQPSQITEFIEGVRGARGHNEQNNS